MAFSPVLKPIYWASSVVMLSVIAKALPRASPVPRRFPSSSAPRPPKLFVLMAARMASGTLLSSPTIAQTLSPLLDSPNLLPSVTITSPTFTVRLLPVGPGLLLVVNETTVPAGTSSVAVQRSSSSALLLNSSVIGFKSASRKVIVSPIAIVFRATNAN